MASNSTPSHDPGLNQMDLVEDLIRTAKSLYSSEMRLELKQVLFTAVHGGSTVVEKQQYIAIELTIEALKLAIGVAREDV